MFKTLLLYSNVYANVSTFVLLGNEPNQGEMTFSRTTLSRVTFSLKILSNVTNDTSVILLQFYLRTILL